MSIAVVDCKTRYRGILDTYPNASAAYSVSRLLNTSYTGACFKVRRSSDNAEMDIGFVKGEMDRATLLNFCGSGDGFIRAWNDQSGNLLNVGQSTAGFQPQIVSSGSLITLNGKPAIYWLDNVRALVANSNVNWKFLNDGTLFSIYSVFQAGIVSNPTVNYPIMGTNNASSANTGFYLAYSDSVNNDRLLHLVSNSSGVVANCPVENNSANAALTANAQHVLSVLCDPSNGTAANRSDIRIDAGSLIQNNINTGAVNNANPLNPLMLGGYGTAKGFIGYFQEVIFYPVKQTDSQNTLIEQNLLNYY